MNEKKMNVKEILKMMEEGLGEEPKPMVLMSKLIPEELGRRIGRCMDDHRRPVVS